MSPRHARQTQRRPAPIVKAEATLRWLSWLTKAGHLKLGVPRAGVKGWLEVCSVTSAMRAARRPEWFAMTPESLRTFIDTYDSQGRFIIQDGWMCKLPRMQRWPRWGGASISSTSIDNRGLGSCALAGRETRADDCSEYSLAATESVELPNTPAELESTRSGHERQWLPSTCASAPQPCAAVELNHRTEAPPGTWRVDGASQCRPLPADEVLKIVTRGAPGGLVNVLLTPRPGVDGSEPMGACCVAERCAGVVAKPTDTIAVAGMSDHSIGSTTDVLTRSSDDQQRKKTGTFAELARAMQRRDEQARAPSGHSRCEEDPRSYATFQNCEDGAVRSDLVDAAVTTQVGEEVNRRIGDAHATADLATQTATTRSSFEVTQVVVSGSDAAIMGAAASLIPATPSSVVAGEGGIRSAADTSWYSGQTIDASASASRIAAVLPTMGINNQENTFTDSSVCYGEIPNVGAAVTQGAVVSSALPKSLDSELHSRSIRSLGADTAAHSVSAHVAAPAPQFATAAPSTADKDSPRSLPSMDADTVSAQAGPVAVTPSMARDASPLSPPRRGISNSTTRRRRGMRRTASMGRSRISKSARPGRLVQRSAKRDVKNQRRCGSSSSSTSHGPRIRGLRSHRKASMDSKRQNGSEESQHHVRRTRSSTNRSGSSSSGQRRRSHTRSCTRRRSRSRTWRRSRTGSAAAVVQGGPQNEQQSKRNVQAEGVDIAANTVVQAPRQLPASTTTGEAGQSTEYPVYFLVEYLENGDENWKWQISRGKSYTVGCDGFGADIGVRDYSLSRRHCSIKLEGPEPMVVVEDLASTNGTFVDGQCVGEVTGGVAKPRMFVAGKAHIIRLGQCTHGFRVVAGGRPKVLGEGSTQGGSLNSRQGLL